MLLVLVGPDYWYTSILLTGTYFSPWREILNPENGTDESSPTTSTRTTLSRLISTPSLPHNRKPTPHRHIDRPPLLLTLGKPSHIDPLPEQNTMRAAPKMEHPQLLALLDMLALLDCDLRRRHLRHADEQHCDQPDLRVIGLDEHAPPCRRRSDVALAGALAQRVGRLCFREVVVEGFRVVGAGDDVGFLDDAGYGCVPAVVAECRQEGLVDGAADELRGERVSCEHVEHAVRLAFDPELVAGLDVARDLVGEGFTGVGDDIVVVGGGDGADAVLEAESAREEVVPGFVAVILGAGVTVEEFFELVRGLPVEVGGCFEAFEGRRTKPAFVVSAETGGAGGRFEEIAPDVDDFFDVLVDDGVEERCEASAGTHWPI